MLNGFLADPAPFYLIYSDSQAYQHSSLGWPKQSSLSGMVRNLDTTVSPRRVEKRADLAGMRRVTQFAQRLSFNLADALARDGEHLANFFEGVRIAVLKAETHADDAFFAGTEFPQHRGHLLFEAQVHSCLRWRDYSLVFDEIA